MYTDLETFFLIWEVEKCISMDSVCIHFILNNEFLTFKWFILAFVFNL